MLEETPPREIPISLIPVFTLKKFIFKGGFLLAYLMEIGRETIDLDFLLTKMNASEGEIEQAVMEIVATESIDGFSFHYEDIELLEQPHMDYPGYRVSLGVAFRRMKDRIHIDVGTGDVVSPTAHDLQLFQYRGKPLFESEISLMVYPPETIFAEKLETVISKGAINSRMKDYHDLLLLSRSSHMIDFKKLRTAIKKTFVHRDTVFQLIDFSEQELKQISRLWTTHLKNLGPTVRALNLPVNIQDVITEINKTLAKLARITSVNHSPTTIGAGLV
jgi:predicted nucleotidyltransferase component of viral defense system